MIRRDFLKGMAVLALATGMPAGAAPLSVITDAELDGANWFLMSGNKMLASGIVRDGITWTAQQSTLVTHVRIVFADRRSFECSLNMHCAPGDYAMVNLDGPPKATA